MRVQGQTCWLWCFANGQVCYYLIDRCRGSPVLQRFFGEAFDGILLRKRPDFSPQKYQSRILRLGRR
ncbi:MAG: hypothetical protein KAY37_09825 [Phycisphaerae bacterium]|nr:hypothetical protein [Phycisphaerae bacterium]